MTVPQVQITARNHYLSLPDPLPLNGAIAICAVLYRESGLRPGSQGVQPSEHGGIRNRRGAYGVASWNGPSGQSKVGDPRYDRQAAYTEYCDKRGLANPADPASYDVLEFQLDFFLHEAANGYPLTWAAVRSTAQFVSIIRTIVEDYERPKAPGPEIADAIKIAAALAAVPLPAPGAPTPLPSVPAPKPPPIVPGPSTPFPDLPPVAAGQAGRIAAIADFLHRARDARIAELIASDPEVVAYDAMLAPLGDVQAPALPPPAAIPAAPISKGTPKMPTIFTHIFTNWMTSGAGAIAGGPAILDILAHGGAANWTQDIPQLATMIVGLLAPDPKTVAK